MGLDNGINLRIKNKETFGPMPAWIKREEWEDKYGYDYEVMYWRKCWNVRYEVLSYLGASDDEYEWHLDLNDMKEILKILKAMYKPHLWQADYDGHMSIWSWDDVKHSYRRELRYMKKMMKWLATKPADSYEVYFYDSY